MPLPRFIDIDGRRYLWRDLVQLRRTQAMPRQPQPTLFALRDDYRPPGERSAAERYQAPSLFTRLHDAEPTPERQAGSLPHSVSYDTIT